MVRPKKIFFKDVIDKNTNKTTSYISIANVASAFSISRATVRNYLGKNRLYKKRYILEYSKKNEAV